MSDLWHVWRSRLEVCQNVKERIAVCSEHNDFQSSAHSQPAAWLCSLYTALQCCEERVILFHRVGGGAGAVEGELGPNMKMNESRLGCKMWPFLAATSLPVCNMQGALPHYLVEHVPTVIRFQTLSKEISVNLCFCRIWNLPLDNQSLICLCLSSNRHCMMCLGGPRQVVGSQGKTW